MLLCSNYEEVYIDMVRSNAEWEVIIKEAYASGLPVYRWCRMNDIKPVTLTKARDRLMKKLALKYPLYNFDKHKGYGTKDHIERLKKYGKSEEHRESFIKKFIQ